MDDPSLHKKAAPGEEAEDPGRFPACEQERPGPQGGTPSDVEDPAREIGGRDGPEPTRYGDWEKGGRCIDF